DRCEPLDVGVDQIRQPMEVGGAPGRPECGPGRKGVPGGCDGEIGLALPTPRDLAERLLVDRRDVRERSLARHALAADEVVRRDLDAGDVQTPAHAILPNASVPTSTTVRPPSTGITAP